MEVEYLFLKDRKDNGEGKEQRKKPKGRQAAGGRLRVSLAEAEVQGSVKALRQMLFSPLSCKDHRGTVEPQVFLFATRRKSTAKLLGSCLETNSHVLCHRDVDTVAVRSRSP